MKNGFRRALSLLIAVCSLAMVFAWPGPAVADDSGDISGSTSAATTFYVYANGNGNGYIFLFATKGSAYVSDYDYYGRFQGYKEENTYGFFRIQVTKSGYDKTYIWAPSATTNTSGVEMSQPLVISFPYSGEYKVVVTPLTRQEINGSYLPLNRFHYWMKNATWIISRTSNCQCSRESGGSQPAANYQVTVNCLDQNGAFIQSYTESVTYSKTIYPRTVNGYTAVTSYGQYITCTNGVCTPASVNFYYNKTATSGTVTVHCYDIANNFIQTYTETVTSGTTIYPKTISGYSIVSGGQSIAFSNGVCSPNTVYFYYMKDAVSGTVTVYCYDTDQQLIKQYTETLTANKTIYPQDIKGYTIVSGGQNIAYSNGVCSPNTVYFYYMKEAVSGTVTVYCYDTDQQLIRQYTETLTAGKTIYPQEISGYRMISGGQSIAYSNGVCSPDTVYFYYMKEAVSGTVTIYCYDTNGQLLRQYTETLTADKTISPQAISGYNAVSGSQYVTFSHGVCSPSAITFLYQTQSPATLSISCYDENGTCIKTYTEQITSSKTVNPQAISGYNIVSSAQYVTYSNGTCSPVSISFSYKKIPTPATVTIRCIDNNGNVIRTTKESITATKTFSPPTISGYTAVSGKQKVTYQNGKCSPTQIDFQYQIGKKVTPGSNSKMVYPTSWDTQFKPGTATHQNAANATRVDKLSTMYDDNAGSSFFWIIYTVETADNIPEFTAYFNGDTISSIGIRNGNLLNTNTYTKYARVKRFDVRIYDNDGNEYKTVLTLPDSYSRDYRMFSLDATYTNVSRIEFWITSTDSFYYGTGAETNVAHLADIAFFK